MGIMLRAPANPEPQNPETQNPMGPRFIGSLLPLLHSGGTSGGSIVGELGEPMILASEDFLGP